jgi:hypothetical protein
MQETGSCGYGKLPLTSKSPFGLGNVAAMPDRFRDGLYSGSCGRCVGVHVGAKEVGSRGEVRKPLCCFA